MRVIHWPGSSNVPHSSGRLTRDEFLNECAERSKSSVEHVLQHHDVTECDCGEEGCPGWQARYMFRNERRRKGLEK